jgi:hypothetical protein
LLAARWRQPQRGRAVKREEAAPDGAAERDAAMAAIEALKAGLEYERGERAKLAAKLAEARKRWLERLIEVVRKR